MLKYDFLLFFLEMKVEDTELKKLFLELLDKDEEFRYAVSGRLGLSEILKKLDTLWEEVKLLREEQNKLWEGQNKLWEGQNRLWEEVKLLREEQNKLWEGQNRLWEEVKSIRGEMKAIRAELKSFGRAVGRTLEDYTMGFVEIILEERGYSREKIRLGRRRIEHEKEEEEINIFNEDPLVVGEVTTCIQSEEKAIEEIGKVVRRINLVQKKFRRKVEYAFLAVGNVSKEVLERLKEEAERNGIELIFGRTIETQELI
jgi:hypothetical protein